MKLQIPTENYGKKVRQNSPQPLQVAQPMLANNKQEQFVLKVSMYSALLLAILGIAFGLSFKSSAIVFDGIVALVSVGLGLLSVITSRFVYREDDDVFQYGYVRFEPMVNLFKSLILIIVCVYALIGGVEDILNGGYTLQIDGAVLYTLCAFILCLVVFVFTRFFAKRLDSEFIGVDNVEWKIDCVLYFGALVAFGAIVWWDREQQSLWTHYIDPILLVLLSLFLAWTPVRIFLANLKDLMMIAPQELDNKITEVMESISVEYGFEDYDTHVAKSGRFFMIEVNLLITDSNAKMSVGEMDIIRNKIEQSLEIPSYKIWLLVSFTANPKWL
ncbi:cation transporter [Helicobacter sp. MIT 05-5294]|uniref:cation diffusion facilitator family transporter n=1 Tax=Helicobacter sp. MIT 05-5294 TaxID=1548150 RepID=UPI00051F8ECF|nr:cation transporter [Helicobacter sp. MIT 05-5294]TLD86313.1 cation transporter [Helicobacter sp. MIT 05-5294]